MKHARGSYHLSQLARVLWAATLATIPVTSFRYFPAGEGTYVRPLAFLPLALLLLVQAVRAFRREIEFPYAAALSPLAAFLMVAAFASVAGILLDPVPLRGQEVVGRVLRAWISVFIGVGFFFGAIWMNRDESELRFSVKWLLTGFVVDVLWSALQAATFHLQVLPKPLVTQWQRLFSLRELIRTNRISGMAYEPSWLAGQITTVYLPWLLAATVTRVRVFRSRWLEPALLAAAIVMVFATYSRGGILTLCIAAGLVLVLAARSELRSVWQWFTVVPSGLAALAWRAGAVLVALLVIAGAGLWLAQKGYISRLWELQAENPADFLVQNSAGARGAYFSSAMRTYEDYPWTGVGLGASGLYMYSRMPDWALTSVPEIARQLSPESKLYPNAKNLYVRLLAETGLPGFIMLMPFMLLLLAQALQALGRGTPSWRYVGIAGLCSWVAVLLYNMTQDSFATPNLWLNFGILAGVSHAAVMHGTDESGADVPRRTSRKPSEQVARKPR